MHPIVQVCLIMIPFFSGFTLGTLNERRKYKIDVNTGTFTKGKPGVLEGWA